VTEILTAAETQALAEHEAVIERGIQTFYEVGTALTDIRDRRLYRAEYGTFEEYADKRWQMSRRRAYELMSAATVVSGIPHTLPKPANAGQATALASVPEPVRADVWAETIERTDGKPTAAAVRDTFEQRQQRPAPDKPPSDEDLFAGQDWIQPEESGFERAITPPKPERPRPEPIMLTLRTHTGEEVLYPKPQGKPTFNASLGAGISWANWSWNPVTGCLHGCEYCYARAGATSERLKSAYPVGFTPLFHEQRLDAPAHTAIPVEHRDEAHQTCGNGECEVCAWRRVFVCSMADLYGRWVPQDWIDDVHASMLASPEWQYILLTKFPDRYVGLDMPPGAWVGTSVDEQKRVRIAERAFSQLPDGVTKWLSLEPLLEPLEFTDLSVFDWVVIGAQTQTQQPDGMVPAFAPPAEWVLRITNQAREAGCRVHWKPNLVDGKPGMQRINEYPQASE
jgi:protein gp37